MSTYKDDLDLLEDKKKDSKKLTLNALNAASDLGLDPTYGGDGSGGGGVLFVTDNEGTLNKTWKEINDAAATSVVIWQEIDTDNDGNYFHFLGHTFYDNVEYWLEFDIASRDSHYFKAASQTDYPVIHT